MLHMSLPAIADTIIAAHSAMPAQMRKAARFVIDHPNDVALLSMREQARRAGVQPATMTRLAQYLGLAGFDALRAAYAGALRGTQAGFAGRAAAQLQAQDLRGAEALADEFLCRAGEHIAALRDPGTLQRIVALATRLAEARRVYCLGLRSSHAAAWHLHYSLSLIADRTVLLDGAGGAGFDPLSRATRDDVLLVVGVQPYTRSVVEATVLAAESGVPVAAITDSPVSPLAERAECSVIVGTQSPSYLHSMAAAFVLSELLAAQVAGQGGDGTQEALEDFDRQLAALNTHL